MPCSSLFRPRPLGCHRRVFIVFSPISTFVSTLKLEDAERELDKGESDESGWKVRNMNISGTRGSHKSQSLLRQPRPTTRSSRIDLTDRLTASRHSSEGKGGESKAISLCTSIAAATVVSHNNTSQAEGDSSPLSRPYYVIYLPKIKLKKSVRLLGIECHFLRSIIISARSNASIPRLEIASSAIRLT